MWAGGKLLSFRVAYDSFAPYALPALVPLATSPTVALEPGEEPVMMAYTYY